MILYGWSKEETEAMGNGDNFWKVCIVWALLYVLAFGAMIYYFPEEENQVEQTE